jgi:hypothetical protein
MRYVPGDDGGRRILEAVAKVSSPTFIEHPRNEVTVVMEVVQGNRVVSRTTLASQKADAAGGGSGPEDARPRILPAGASIMLPKGSTLRMTVTPDVMIDLPSCVPALCAWCSLGTSTHQISLR